MTAFCDMNMYNSFQLLDVRIRLCSVTQGQEYEWNILLATHVNIIMEMIQNNTWRVCFITYEYTIHLQEEEYTISPLVVSR